MFVDKHGERVHPYRPLDRSEELAERFRDIIAVKLHAKRMPLRWIGLVLGMSKTTLLRRMEEIPSEARDYYRTESLDRLVPSVAD